MEEERNLAARPATVQSELVTFAIPVDLLRQFKQDVRVVVKFPGLIGIPLPDIFLNPDVLSSVREFEPMLVPRQVLR